MTRRRCYLSIVSMVQVTLDTSFKQFVEAKGLSLAAAARGTALYTKLIKEFNELKQSFLDREEMEERRQAIVFATKRRKAERPQPSK